MRETRTAEQFAASFEIKYGNSGPSAMSDTAAVAMIATSGTLLVALVGAISHWRKRRPRSPSACTAANIELATPAVAKPTTDQIATKPPVRRVKNISHNFSCAAKTEVEDNSNTASAFTLVELLVVIAVMAILVALLMPVLSRAKAQTRRTACVGNLSQIALGIRIYSDEANDSAPALGAGQRIWFRYRELLQSYLGLKGPPSPDDKVFACPADTFYYRLNVNNGTMSYVPQGHHMQSNFVYSSYEFNGANQATNTNISLLGIKALPGISGRKLTTIKHPDRTVLAADASAFIPYSWHQPKPPTINPQGYEMPLFDNAKNAVSFVDGHVSYINIYWNNSTSYGGYYSFSYFYNPPAGYDYQWSPD